MGAVKDHNQNFHIDVIMSPPKMPSAIRECFFFLIFSFGSITTTYAAYCSSSSKCCYPYSGLGGKTCPGIGTTDTSDLLGYLHSSGETYGILAGYGVYVILRVFYNLTSGVGAIVNLAAIFGFVLEVPNRSGGQTCYLIDMTGCPKISVITAQTTGRVPSTTLSYATIYEIIQQTHLPYPAPCNLVPGLDLRKQTNELSHFDDGTPLTLSNVISFQFHPFEAQYSQVPEKAIAAYGLRVERVNCTFYVQSGYTKGAEACYKPDKLIPLGQGLVEAGFDFSRLGQENGLCLLGTAIGKATAQSIHPYYLYSLKLCLVTSPYKYVSIIAGYYQTDLGNLLYRLLFDLC